MHIVSLIQPELALRSASIKQQEVLLFMQLDPQIVEPAILHELRSGEQLLWWGRTDPKHQVRTNYVFSFIVYAAITCTVAALLYIDISLYISTHGFLPLLSAPFLALLLLLLLYIAYALYRLYHSINVNSRNAIYAITNQRIITRVALKHGFMVTSRTAEDIGLIQSIETDDGWGDIKYGHPCPVQVGSASTTTIATLAGIPNVRMVENLLTSTFENSSK